MTPDPDPPPFRLMPVDDYLAEQGAVAEPVEDAHTESLATADADGPIEAAVPDPVEPTEGATQDDPEAPAPAPVPVPVPSAPASVDVDAALVGIERSLRTLATAAKRSSEFVDELHSDNQRLRSSESEQLLSPTQRALLRHYDVVADLSRRNVSGDFELIRQAVLDLLDDLGLVHVPTTAGEPFDRAVHRSVSTVDTADAEADRTVAVVVRERFDRPDGRTFRPADVRVSRFVMPAPEPALAVPDPDITSPETPHD